VRMFVSKFARAAALSALTVAAPAFARETRCGWIVNPTPANWWLTDHQGEWELGVQGGYQAPGMDKLPDFTGKQWVKTNGDYGYGCACLTVETDAKEKRVTRILRAAQRPLKQCGADKKLKRPEN
jgi:hypothetical protein